MSRQSLGQFGKIKLGLFDNSTATISNLVNTGIITNSGVTFLGLPGAVGAARAAVMIGPAMGLSLPASLEVVGITNLLGNTNQIGLFTCTGASIFTGTKITNGPNISTSIEINQKLVCTRPAVIPLVMGRCTGNKGFDIPHPKKPNHRLRHICVEGPESAIYIRGVLRNQNYIDLPQYWDGLVDPSSITVQLTQIATSQDLMVDKIERGRRIIIKSGNGTAINCCYHIWANRIGEKLHVEYEGSTPADYPGNNDLYSIAGYHYDVKEG